VEYEDLPVMVDPEEAVKATGDGVLHPDARLPAPHERHTYSWSRAGPDLHTVRELDVRLRAEPLLTRASELVVVAFQRAGLPVRRQRPQL
jgi:hypothetical protein